ncbi:IS5 family transposase [Wolbachia pipientis wAlbB]|nr:IS5 family transposase [Wolbachia pipientis wAlbB]QDW09568.1 IS5 family transposase [Wolbachia pipientis]THA19988.1 IS5 family transposase [Wolbachia endosymbiont of Aedes albopictus]CCE77676.1 conserved hypothetical protein [Wolbachia pipientis wAlbB]
MRLFYQIWSLVEKTKSRKLDLYDIFCGVLYALKSGYQWRMLPKGFPKTAQLL